MGPEMCVRSYRVMCVSASTLSSEDGRSYRCTERPKINISEIKSNNFLINNTNNRCVSISFSSPFLQ